MESMISLRVDNLRLLLKEHVQWFATLEEDSQLFFYFLRTFAP